MLHHGYPSYQLSEACQLTLLGSSGGKWPFPIRSVAAESSLCILIEVEAEAVAVVWACFSVPFHFGHLLFLMLSVHAF